MSSADQPGNRRNRKGGEMEKVMCGKCGEREPVTDRDPINGGVESLLCEVCAGIAWNPDWVNRRGRRVGRWEPHDYSE